MRGTKVAVLVAVAVTSLGAAGTATAGEQEWRPYPGTDVEVEADLADPAESKNNPDHFWFKGVRSDYGRSRVIAQVIRLIDDTHSCPRPAGRPGTQKCSSSPKIYAGIHSIDRRDVLNAFERAVNAGVEVYVVHNGNDWPEVIKKDSGCCRKSVSDDLHRLLTPTSRRRLPKRGHRFCHYWPGKLPDSGSMYDPDRSAACTSAEEGFVMHAKYMLFSHTKTSGGIVKPNVVWFGSTNLVKDSNEQFNNTVTVYGNRGLFDSFKLRIFDPMWLTAGGARGKRTSSFGGPIARGYAQNISVFPSPMKYDRVLEYLERLENSLPDRRDHAGKNPNGCYAYVMHTFLGEERVFKAEVRNGETPTSDSIFERLNILRNVKGCDVRVLVGRDEGGEDKLRPKGWYWFRDRAQIPLRAVPRTHDKLILLRKAGSSVVLTGSHNLTMPSWQSPDSNDELLVALNQTKHLWNAYAQHWCEGWNTSYYEDRTAQSANCAEFMGYIPED